MNEDGVLDPIPEVPQFRTRCYGLHKWEPWSETYQQKMVEHLDGMVMRRYVDVNQKRKCARCGKIVIRTVM